MRCEPVRWRRGRGVTYFPPHFTATDLPRDALPYSPRGREHTPHTHSHPTVTRGKRTLEYLCCARTAGTALSSVGSASVAPRLERLSTAASSPAAPPAPHSAVSKHRAVACGEQASNALHVRNPATCQPQRPGTAPNSGAPRRPGGQASVLGHSLHPHILRPRTLRRAHLSNARSGNALLLLLLLLPTRLLSGERAGSGERLAVEGEMHAWRRHAWRVP